MKIVELNIDEENGFLIDAISLVKDPAIEKNFVALNANNENVIPTPLAVALAQVEKREIVGAALIPNKMILRLDEFGNPYQIYFSSSTVRKAAYAFLKNGFQTNTTLDHTSTTEDVYVVESWIVEFPDIDKSVALGLGVLPVGTWCVKMKVDNENVWTDLVKTSKVKGFSIEGLFVQAAAHQFDKKLIEVEKWILGKNENHCELCHEISKRRNTTDGVYFLKGVLPKPPIHDNCKCRLESKVVKDNPKNYKK